MFTAEGWGEVYSWTLAFRITLFQRGRVSIGSIQTHAHLINHQYRTTGKSFNQQQVGWFYPRFCRKSGEPSTKGMKWNYFQSAPIRIDGGEIRPFTNRGLNFLLQKVSGRSKRCIQIDFRLPARLPRSVLSKNY